MTEDKRDGEGGGGSPAGGGSARKPREGAGGGRKRFYRDVGLVEEADGWALVLDGRAVKTPQRNPLKLVTGALGEAVAEEWRAQDGEIDPESMVMTRLANTAIDRVMGRESEVAGEIVAYAGSDLICYRAEHPGELVALQAEGWDPLVQWAESALGARLVVTRGIVHVRQRAEAMAAVARRLGGESAYALTAIHNMTTLTGSAVLALAHRYGVVDARQTWHCAHIDEDWQISQWGEDHEARLRRERRWLEFEASSRFLELAESS